MIDAAVKKLPVLVSWKKSYWCIVTSIKRGIVSIADPAKGEIKIFLNIGMVKIQKNILDEYMGDVDGLSAVVNFDRIIMLENGIIAEEGSYDELMKKGGKFAALVRKQMVQTAPKACTKV